MVLGTLGDSLLGNILFGKGVMKAGEGGKVTKKGRSTIRAGKEQLMPPHPLTNFETQRYYQNEPKLNGVYSRNHLLKIKDGSYDINLGEYANIGTHWVVIFVKSDKRTTSHDKTYYDSFGVDHIPKEIRKYICNNNIRTVIFRIRVYGSMLWRYFFY